jgi:glycosyltransferase involved in cell wall biosynthesis
LLSFDYLHYFWYNHKKIRIGWAGGSAHSLDLAIINKIIPTILDKYKDVEFMIFGGIPPYMKATDRILHHSQWFSIDEYPKQLAQLGFDIAVAPLKDNEFNRCKSNLRWLEMSALKIPTVCSDVEPFKKSVVNDSTGMLANTPEEWIQALSELIEHKTLRESIGKNAYNVVKKCYNISRTSEKYIDALQSIHNDKSLDKLPIISENPLWEEAQLKELQQQEVIKN